MDVGGGGNVQSDINVTPFCDVCLVLLVIFMVITPMLQSGVPVVLPTSRNPQGQPEADREGNIILAVKINKDDNQAHYYFGEKDRPLEALQEDLSDAYRENPAKKVFLKGYKQIDFIEIKKVLKIVQNVGFKQIGLLSQHVDANGMAVSGNAASEIAQ
jgi:biopolymer transport protein ExbD